MSDNSMLGTYRGIVVDNNDPAAGARVTLKIPQVLGDADSNWAVPAVPTSTIPAPGDMLWISFEGGDVTRPIYTVPGILQLQEAIEGLGGPGDTFTGSPPKAPSALTLSTSSVVTREGVTKSLVGINWVAPTENQDGSVPVKQLNGFRIQYSYNGTDWTGSAFTPDTSSFIDNLLPGTTVHVRVQALSAVSGPGLWATADVTTGGAAAPDTPSTPTAVGQINGVRISWDGYNAADDFMPFQSAYVQIQRATSAVFSSYVEVGSLADAGDFFDKSAVNGQQYFYRLVSVSQAGDRSAPSSAVSATGFADPAIGNAQNTADNAATAAGNAQTAANNANTAAGNAQTAANNALTAANGKNKVTFATTPPGTTANTAGDIWFQKDSVSGATIIGQWEGAGGTSWVAKAISNEVIASVNAASITVGLLTGQQIAGTTITAAHLSSVLAIISKLCSSSTGRRWEADSAGIRVIDSNGGILVNLPTDSLTPASFNGDLVASSLIVSDQLAIRGLVNEISKASALVLSAGTTPPSSPPAVTLDWENIPITVQGLNQPAMQKGLVWWQSKFWTVEATSTGVRLQAYSTTGTPGTASATLATPLSTGTHSITVHGSNVYMLYQTAAGTSWTVKGWDSTFTQVATWTYTATATERTPTITSDGTNILIVCNDTASKVKWRTFNPTTGALVATVTTTSSGDIQAAVTTTADLGAQRTFILYTTSTTLYSYDSTGAITNDSFLMASPSIDGICYDGTRFRTYDASSSTAVLYRHASTNWSGADIAGWFIGATWYDNDSTTPLNSVSNTGVNRFSNTMNVTTATPHNLMVGDRVTVVDEGSPWDGTYTVSTVGSATNYSVPNSGLNQTKSIGPYGTTQKVNQTHETAMGPRKNFAMRKRARLNIALPPFPARPTPTTGDDINASRVYIGTSSTNANMQRVAEVTSPNLTLDAITISPITATAPTSGNFPPGTPAKITSYDGTSTVLKGDGNATIGGLAVTVDQYGVNPTTTTLAADEVSVKGTSVSRGAQSGSAGYAQITANAVVNSVANTPTDIPGLSVTVTVPNGRRLKITAEGHLYTSVASDQGSLLIRESGTTLQQRQGPSMVVVSRGYAVTATVVVTPAGGTHTYNVSITRVSGTGNVNFSAAATQPGFIVVEDIGPA